jgi:hypothetical protein
MAAEPMREAAATITIMFPFLRIDVSSSSCGWRRGQAAAVALGPVSLDEATLGRPGA